jgi:hypothetical protein
MFKGSECISILWLASALVLAKRIAGASTSPRMGAPAVLVDANAGGDG